MMTTAVTELGAITAALDAASAHPELPLPMQFTEGLDYWPTDENQAVEIQEALDAAYHGRLRWNRVRATASRHTIIQGRQGSDVLFVIWIPEQ